MTLISADNNFAIMAVLFLIAGGAFLAERTRIGANLTGAVVAILAAILAANLRLIPHSAPAYSFGFTYFVPVLIPLFLFKANLRERERNDAVDRRQHVEQQDRGPSEKDLFDAYVTARESTGEGAKGLTAKKLSQVLANHSTWPVLASFLGLAAFGGLYVVPLFVTMQVRSALEQRAQVISANNIINALFMVGAALATIALLQAGEPEDGVAQLERAGRPAAGDRATQAIRDKSKNPIISIGCTKYFLISPSRTCRAIPLANPGMLENARDNIVSR